MNCLLCNRIINDNLNETANITKELIYDVNIESIDNSENVVINIHNKEGSCDDCYEYSEKSVSLSREIFAFCVIHKIDPFDIRLKTYSKEMLHKSLADFKKLEEKDWMYDGACFALFAKLAKIEQFKIDFYNDAMYSENEYCVDNKDI